MIHQHAPHTDLAHKFINFMLGGKNAAEITNNIGAGNPNAAAQPFIKPELKTISAINPSPEQTTRLEQLTDLDIKTRRDWNKAWTEIKARKK